MCVCVCGWILWSQFAGSLDSPPCDAVDGGGGGSEEAFCDGRSAGVQTNIHCHVLCICYLLEIVQ